MANSGPVCRSSPGAARALCATRLDADHFGAGVGAAGACFPAGAFPTGGAVLGAAPAPLGAGFCAPGAGVACPGRNGNAGALDDGA